MDYEKAYKDALKRAKKLYEQGTITESLSYVFPELQESKDEKIRKSLIEMVHDTTGDELWVDYNIHKEDALAWLEKQVPKPKWSYEDEANLNNIIWLCNNCLNGYETTWIPSQAEKIKHLIETIKERGLTLQKPKWSEEDEKRIERICNFVLKNRKGDTDEIYQQEQDVDWLRTLKDRVEE